MRTRNNDAGDMPYYRQVPKKITEDIWYYENPRSMTIVVQTRSNTVSFNLSKSRLQKIVRRMN